MWTRRWSAPRVLACAVLVAGLLAAAVQGDDEAPPSESQCRPYIEKALKELEGGDPHSGSDEDNDGSEETITSQEQNNDGEPPDNDSGENDLDTADVQNEDDDSKEGDDSLEVADEPYTGEDSKEDEDDSKVDEDDSKDDGDDSKDDSKENDDGDSAEKEEEQDDANSKEIEGDDNNVADDDDDDEKTAEEDDSNEDSKENVGSAEAQDDDDSKEADTDEIQDEDQVSKESIEDIEADASDDGDNDDDSKEGNQPEEESDKDSKSKEGSDDDSGEKVDDKESSEDQLDSKEDDNESEEGEDAKPDSDGVDDSKDDTAEDEDSADDSDEDGESGEDKDDIPEEDLLKVSAIPANLKSRDHITQILRLDDESSENEVVVERSADIILRDLKRIYENNIKPLEGLYKYRDLSNRHFGDPEIFSKPLLLLMGPWSGGKSSIINYLTDIEFTEWSLRTGAEPSPAYFNILMHGKEPQVLDGTQLAADWTFSGLQKFGQGLEERLRGLKYPSKILEKINIVEIPGILEVRKQVSRVFPFNDACQWFIDRADIIFLVYDPSKLDVGPETEAILDQLKGRESQVRIVLNKADIVKPEELLRVQGALIWNISPLMSSAAPPALYAASLWARPLAAHAPGRLLAAQERALLTDLRSAIDRRIDNKIASARRFAVRVRNHAKMVDCYLTTYYNHKTIFGNKKVIAEAIIEHPQNYHIYEGLSTLTNISRYDLPDPETYKDFFRLNALYDFQPLSSTCTYFRGCPINRLDIAIAYDLPELVGKYKKMVESAVPQGMPKS